MTSFPSAPPSTNDQLSPIRSSRPSAVFGLCLNQLREEVAVLPRIVGRNRLGLLKVLQGLYAAPDPFVRMYPKKSPNVRTCLTGIVTTS